jgi:hypothetical protein
MPQPPPAHAPPASDPRWAEWSKPVAAYLSEPRSWADLRAWSRKERINGNLLRHILAWLEEHRLASSRNQGRALVWISGGTHAARGRRDCGGSARVDVSSARAVEEVLEERIAWLQREADTAHKAASISEHNEDLANKQLDAATKRIQLAVSALVKGRYGTQEEAQEAIGKALESLKDDPA